MRKSTKSLSMIALFALTLISSAALAVPFPTLHKMVVTSEGHGDVTILVDKTNCSSPIDRLVLQQYCPDRLRSTAQRIITVMPFEVTDGTNSAVLKFKLDEFGLQNGATCLNFTKEENSSAWLGVPDCKIRTAGKIKMGMSFKTSSIANSGGAMFVYTGTGDSPESPIDNSDCDDERAVHLKRQRANIEDSRHSVVPAHYPKVIKKDGPCEEVMNSIGRPSEDDPADEKTLHQKARKTLVIVKEAHLVVKKVHKSLSDPKDGRSTVHDKLDSIEKKIDTKSSASVPPAKK